MIIAPDYSLPEEVKSCFFPWAMYALGLEKRRKREKEIVAIKKKKTKTTFGANYFPLRFSDKQRARQLWWKTLPSLSDKILYGKICKYRALPFLQFSFAIYRFLLQIFLLPFHHPVVSSFFLPFFLPSFSCMCIQYFVSRGQIWKNWAGRLVVVSLCLPRK